MELYKTVDNGIHSPGYERILKKGIRGLKAQINEELKRDSSADDEKKATLAAMNLGLDGVLAYTRNLVEVAG